MNKDFRDLLAAFCAHDVEFLIVGAYAVTFHARPRFTKDLDVWVGSSPSNAPRVYRALAAFGAPLRSQGIEPNDFATDGVVYQIGVEPNRIDILTSVEALDFASCFGRRVEASYGDVAVGYLSRADLIANKVAIGRAKDLEDVEELRRSD